LGHAKHDDPRNQHVSAVVDKARAMVMSSGIHDEQSSAGQHKDRKSQGAIKSFKQMKDSRPQRGLFDDAAHGRIILPFQPIF